MVRAIVGIVLPLLIAIASKGSSSPLAGKEVWDYVDVRDGAHMFWWLYYADNPSVKYQQLPLVMWLQGGPGGSGSGFGNFGEIGPLNTDLQARKSSWVKAASVLFVDNPVGTGFSYTERPDCYATDVDTVASDMLVLLKRFFAKVDEFQSIPFYIFSESYGGKMAAAISLQLIKAVAQGDVKCSFAGVALGDSWISPVDSVMTWGPYLYATSLLDDRGLKEVSGAAEAVKDAVEQKQFQKATELWSVAETVVEQNTNGVNFYNILSQEPPDHAASSAGRNFISLQARRHVHPLQRQTLSELMNGAIREKLGIIPDNVTWGGQAEEVFSYMAGDFMRPVVNIVDELLAAGVNVSVYNGQLDLIVDTLGQELWVQKLQWAGLPGFNKLRWTALDDPTSPGVTGAFVKSFKNFAFYWILKAGHMIPSDQGAMALQMMKMITKQV
ncbi:retinoid-inducible serine carboxypeptidase isoform X1 [Dunckerocampus dactyliophorus]|uniref:retinoid-inducible serine carboxypeptidase isoform X1 n=2 Tax=Dunckerocampus dactyliophorus TaxID=161453 RepID=UPI002405F834|nr:retinoid-inducible serine carboxypeptidase isoform X1 [Dunckerocampus dactyliophorus]